MTRKFKSLAKVKTIRDVFIPAGSEAEIIPYVRSDKIDIVCILISHTKDHVSEWTMPREDAIKMGIIPDEAKDD